MADNRSAETMTALEACPFCGSHRLRLEPTYREDRREWHGTVDCLNCRCSGPSAQTPNGARAAWNTRALSARDAQIRREALVEGARWAHEKLATVIAPGATWWFDPAAILEREKS